MKITIVESEIQEAIRAHIERQITVKDGMEITMEIRATRGEDGFIANIDISPIKAGADTPRAVVAEQVTATQATISNTIEATPIFRPRVTRKAVEAAPAAEAEAEVEEVEAAQVTLSPEGEAATISAPKSLFGARPTEVTTEEVAEPADDGVEDVEGSQPLKRSIFAGMSRPVNDSSEAAA